ncbi:hypothetical protein LX99_04809 [Mucilaginibacter oryzae]|uniref:Uncharacterized protein n=1 Tax=Mucilaginibacter oryzae TaxID=468058 RepID=A0A316GXF2_9SPHI|nr:hypothetical protein [Mucilaginibacter oryzae]PWK68285.1 hypothetical protein LX99_04809 [Mucilaginibacter oryzae]
MSTKVLTLLEMPDRRLVSGLPVLVITGDAGRALYTLLYVEGNYRPVLGGSSHGSVERIEPEFTRRAEIGLLSWVFFIERLDIGSVDGLRWRAEDKANEK